MPFNLEVDRLVLGNFTASFGQGIVFESSDFFSPRKTGFGFSKRLNGIHADETRNSQYTLKGLGLQLSNDIFRLLFTVFCILIVINGSNFIDGMNTLCVGYYLIIISTIYYLWLVRHRQSYQIKSFMLNLIVYLRQNISIKT